MAGALYSHIVAGDAFAIFASAMLGLILVVGSYISYHKKFMSSANTR